MLVEDVVRLARIRLDDTIEPYAVSDESLVTFTNRAQRQACERGLLLSDSTTTAVCQIALTAGRRSYPLDPRVLAVTSAAVQGDSCPLVQVSALDALLPAYALNVPSGAPRIFFIRGTTLNVLPTPDEAATLNLEVYRYPLVDVEGISDDLEIAEQHHADLVHWVCYEAYSVYDSEIFDKDAAERELALFTARFGLPRSANELRSWRELPRDTRVRMRYY